MIGWLRGPARDPAVTIGGRQLPLAIRRHARARRMTMRLAPDGSEIRITLPQWGRTADALVFVKSRSEWLEQQLAAVPSAAPPAPGGWLLYRGERLAIEWNPALPRRPALAASALRLGGPEASLTARLQRWLESEALRLFQQDLAHYCALAGRAEPRLRLSRAHRRWGSCSTARPEAPDAQCIRINWRLIQAPDEVRRSVVAHEVAHLVHFDHSPAFHRLLSELFGERLDECDAWLRREGRGLYAAFG